jgi:hypothetical protein
VTGVQTCALPILNESRTAPTKQIMVITTRCGANIMMGTNSVKKS